MRLFAVVLFFSSLFSAFGQVTGHQVGYRASVNFAFSAAVDWRNREVSAETSFNLAQAGLRLPAGRLMGEEMLHRAWPRLFRSELLSLRVDSSTTLGDLHASGALSLADVDAISRTAVAMPPSLSADLSSMIGRYTLNIEGISALLLTHGRTTAPEIPLIPVPTSDYSGIIIIAYRELPVWGRHGTAFIEPGLFPRIWDTEMNIIFERTMLSPDRTLMVHYADPQSIFRPTPSGLDGELAELVGPRPLRVFARQAFGIYPTDAVIDRNDALRIVSSAHNRRLLQEGRVIFVLDAGMLGN
ncbi:MAG: polymerase [Treponema sp.]|jgi:hypothetical protein|nr:polymerase [Treponema sp.]